MLPLYNKIRIPYQLVAERILVFDAGLRTLARVLSAPIDELVWDVRLSTVNDYKAAIAAGVDVANGQREKVLTTRLPRFIWVATGRRQADTVVEIVFDATDIASGRFVRAVRVADPVLDAALQVAAENEHLRQTELGRALCAIIDRHA